MPTYRSSGGGGGYDYVQDGEPTDAVEGEEWYDPGANAAYAYTGSKWIEQTVSDHSQLSGRTPGEHFDAGNALAFASGALDVQGGSLDHDALQNTGTSAHHIPATLPDASHAKYGSSTAGQNNTSVTASTGGASEWEDSGKDISVDWSGESSVNVRFRVKKDQTDDREMGVRLVNTSDGTVRFQETVTDNTSWQTVTKAINCHTLGTSETYNVELLCSTYTGDTHNDTLEVLKSVKADQIQ